MVDISEDSRRVDVWVAMAEHYLDTETRQEIPSTALKCARAGLSLEEARNIWRFEVCPAVSFNAFDIAGEWAGWDREWLVGRIGRVRIDWKRRPIARLLGRPWLNLGCGVAESVERCLRALLAVESADDRERLAKDLAFLAQHYFDFCPKEVGTLEPGGYERIRALYPQPFRHLMAPAMIRGESAKADLRVEDALREGRER
jgi:hypothetical protein